MKLLLDFLPIIVFFVAYKFGGIYAATVAAMVATVLQLAWLKLSGKKIEMMNWISLVIIVLFGGATLIFHDENFIKWKPTVLYWLFAVVLWGAATFTGKNLIRSMLSQQLQLPAAIWARVNWMWIAFFAVMGAANLTIAMNFPTDTWVNFKLWGSLGMTLLFMLAQGLYLSRHMRETTQPGQSNP